MFLFHWENKSSQVTFIYIALLTIQIENRHHTPKEAFASIDNHSKNYQTT